MKRSKRAEKRRELKRKAIDYRGGCCEACGYDRCLSALTFHHINPDEKDFGISELMKLVSWERIKLELDKCIVLCTNCHSEVHEGIIDGYIAA